MSARNGQLARRARMAQRARQAPVEVVPSWDGVVSREEIAAVVREVVTGDARRLYGMVPEQLCLSYATAGAFVAGLATGRRHALQIGGCAEFDFQRKPVWLYGPGWGEGVPEVEFHTWFSQVPPGADPELLWSLPPWAQVCDLTLFDSSWLPVAPYGRPPLPSFCWDSPAVVRERFGLAYKPDRAVTMRILDRVFVEGGADHRWLAYAARTAAARLGFGSAGLVPLVPGSFMVGHRPRQP